MPLLLAVLAAAAALAAAGGRGRAGGPGLPWGLRPPRFRSSSWPHSWRSSPWESTSSRPRPGATSSFTERYLLPGAFGWAILCAHVVNRVLGLGSRVASPPASRVLALAQAVGVVAFLGWCGASLVDAARLENAQDLPAPLPAAVGSAEPVVVEYIHEFMTLHFYSPEPRRYVFLLDPEAGIKAGGGAPANMQIMAAFRRQFPDRFREVLPAGEFLAGTRAFWIKVYKLEWWEYRMAHSPDFVADAVVADKRLIHESRRR